jgi:hypothetical protein
VASRTDFFLPVGLLYLLVVFAALVSPHPVVLTVLSVVVFTAAWLGPILGFNKTNSEKLTSVIFADGRVRLESVHGCSDAGILNGQQWCTRHLAVLRIANGDTKGNLVIMSFQQQAAGDFRRLSVWLRQDLCGTGLR